MEFKELSTSAFKQNVIHAFNLTSSSLNIGLLGSTSEALLLEMRHSSSATNTFPYAVETTKLPITRPASEIVKKFDLALIYSNTNFVKRQYIALDPVFIWELSEEPAKFQPVVLAWSPKKLFKNRMLAIVSNNGTCELRRRNSMSREWKIEVCNLNQLHFEMFPVPELSDNEHRFENLVESVENTCTTAFSWNMDPLDKRSMFVTANATGWILLFSIDEEGQVSSLARHRTSLNRISLIYFVGNFILTCSVNGIVKIFELKDKQIVDVDTLWPNADRLACKKLTMSFCKATNRWFCVTSKASHVIVFVLSMTGKLLFKSRKYLGNIKITGFDILSLKEYIFATITGAVKLIKLDVNKDNVEIIEELIKYEFDRKNYQILGLVSSPNKVIWTFILHHNKPYKYPSTYNFHDAIVSVCSFSGKDAFKQLTEDPPRILASGIDCFEAIRLEILKDSISTKFEAISIQDLKITKSYFRKLQLKLLIMNAGIAYQRVKFNHVKKANTIEIVSITKLIESVHINLRLQRLRSLRSYTPFQMLSGKCLRHKLQQLQAELINKEDVFRNIHENLNTLSDCLLMDLDGKFEKAQENCSYCESPIDFSTLMCPAMHSVPRCSISYLQIPLFTKNHCSSCNRLFIHDVESLKSLFGDSEEDLKCPYCGIAINIDMTESLD